MKKIDGEVLGAVWYKLSEKERRDILQKLKEYFQQLSNIPHPRPGTICSAAANEQPLHDHPILNGDLGFGPFETESQFNLFLRGGNESGTPSRTGILEKFIKLQAQKKHRICFTYWDTSPLNIMFKREGFEKNRTYKV